MDNVDIFPKTSSTTQYEIVNFPPLGKSLSSNLNNDSLHLREKKNNGSFPPFHGRNILQKNRNNIGKREGNETSNTEPILNRRDYISHRMSDTFNNPMGYNERIRPVPRVYDKNLVKSSIYTPINFWFEDPSVLFQTFEIMPNQEMTDAERLNAMTRVIIIITAIMFIVKFPLWWMFLVIGIISVIVLWYIIKGRSEEYENYHMRQTEYLRPPRKSIIKPYNPPNSSRSNRSNILQTIQSQPINLISIP